jgi:hypothetical protein
VLWVPVSKRVLWISQDDEGVVGSYQGGRTATLFYSLQCQDRSTPQRMTYAPLAQLQAGAQRATGIDRDFTLPDIDR